MPAIGSIHAHALRIAEERRAAHETRALLDQVDAIHREQLIRICREHGAEIREREATIARLIEENRRLRVLVQDQSRLLTRADYAPERA